MQTIQYELKDGIATLTFDEPGSPVNTMCAQWQTDLVEATAQVVKDKDAIKGIVLASNKTTFFAGAFGAAFAAFLAGAFAFGAGFAFGAAFFGAGFAAAFAGLPETVAPSRTAAWPAARRAIGIRKGEQLT